MTEAAPHAMESVSNQLHPVLLEDFHAIAEGIDAGKLRGSRWLVTGATGMVPAFLVHFLCWLNEREQLGLELHAWVRSRDKAATRFPWQPDCSEWFHVATPDWEHPASWSVPGITHLLHAASPATPAACRADPDGVVICNVEATRCLLKQVAEKQLQAFLFLSSSEVYGSFPEDVVPVEEDTGLIDPASSRALYPLSKRLGEALCHEAFRNRTVPVRIARLFHTYGPGMDLERDGRIFADLVGNAVRGEPLLLKGDGMAKRAFCYLGDTTEALLKLALNGADGGTYNIGNPKGILSMKELADLIIGLAENRDLKRVVMGGDGPQSVSSTVFPNIEHIHSIGWSPRTAPKEGFARTLKFFTE